MMRIGNTWGLELPLKRRRPAAARGHTPAPAKLWIATAGFLPLVLILALISSMFFTPAATPLYATTSPGCSASGPASGAYTVTLCFSSPAVGATLVGDQTVTATMTVSGTNPPTAGGKLFFYLSGQYLLTDYQSPYSFTLPTNRWVDGPRL